MPYLNNGWASGNSVITDGGIAAGEHYVALASNGRSTLGRLGHLDREPSINSSRSAKEISRALNATREIRELTQRRLVQ